MNSIERQGWPSGEASEKPIVKKKAGLPVALGLAAALHGPLIPGVTEAAKEGARLSRAWIEVKAREAERLVHHDTEREAALRGKIKAQIEDDPRQIDLKDAFLGTECARAFSSSECDLAKSILESKLSSLRQRQCELDRRQLLGEIVRQFQGEYDETRSMMTDLLITNRGNCEARSKAFAVALQELGLDAEGMDVQDFGDHKRLVVRLQGVDYPMEGGVNPMPKGEWAGTLRFPAWRWLEDYVGIYSPPQDPEPGEFEQRKPTVFITDTFLRGPKSTKKLRPYNSDLSAHADGIPLPAISKKVEEPAEIDVGLWELPESTKERWTVESALEFKKSIIDSRENEMNISTKAIPSVEVARIFAQWKGEGIPSSLYVGNILANSPEIQAELMKTRIGNIKILVSLEKAADLFAFLDSVDKHNGRISIYQDVQLEDETNKLLFVYECLNGKCVLIQDAEGAHIKKPEALASK